MPSLPQSRLLTKIYSSSGVPWSRGFAHSGLSGEHVEGVVFRIANANLVVSSGATDFFAASDVEEWSPKQYLEWSIFDDLDLEIDRDGAHTGGRGGNTQQAN